MQTPSGQLGVVPSYPSELPKVCKWRLLGVHVPRWAPWGRARPAMFSTPGARRPGARPGSSGPGCGQRQGPASSCATAVVCMKSFRKSLQSAKESWYLHELFGACAPGVVTMHSRDQEGLLPRKSGAPPHTSQRPSEWQHSDESPATADRHLRPLGHGGGPGRNSSAIYGAVRRRGGSPRVPQPPVRPVDGASRDLSRSTSKVACPQGVPARVGLASLEAHGQMEDDHCSYDEEDEEGHELLQR